jgi:ABC-type glycerol-3-phosphate transport system substrate-binding protein
MIGGYFDFLGMSLWIQSAGIAGMEEFFSYGSAEVFNYQKQPGKGKYEALEAFTQLFGPNTNNSLKGSMSKNHTEAQMSFLKGEAAMIINGSWLETEMIRDLPKGFEMRMMRVPYLSTAQKDAEGKKNNKGKTISGTKSKAKKQAIDKATPGLNKKERETLYEIFNVGKTAY